ncbi:winged helix-turn-helix domain-containing protein [Alteromonas sp. McT4-15]|uniref:winged helix-turn-helix domain-containing protein n=1 Tax=Alteromonas sp. McT4-15 TaxID=2881256 RepID=UPI001CF84081|nr:winged helix-turn-helix domain-containing protein [Alteromonas sp. McT4-15]MCB4435140.1 winged helix-turn-helix domain-containing protein [Alteromonas sp. McT4-15]
MNDLNRQFSIGGLTIDPLANTLKFNSHIEKLSPKVMEVFCALFQGNGTVVTREQLLDSVWADRFGGDESLSRAISELRKSLSRLLDTNKKIITTVPKRGYRLELSLLTEICQVQRAAVEAAPELPTTHSVQAHSVKKRSPFVYLLMLATVLIAIVTVFFSVFGDNSQKEYRVLVIPFDVTDSDNKDERILANGLLELSLTHLSHVDNFKVASRTSSAYFKTNKHSLREIQSLLPVDLILEGAVRRDGNYHTVTYRLVEVDSGFTLFSESKTVESLNIQGAVNDLVMNTTAHLGIEHKLIAPSPQSEEAYRLYLLAMDILLQNYTLEALQKAQDYLIRANAQSSADPLIVEAITSNYLEMMNLTSGEEQKDVISSAQDFLKKSRELGVSSSTLSFFEGMLYMPLISDPARGDIQKALAHFSEAKMLGEKSFNFYFNYTYLLTIHHQYKEALAIAKEGIATHPLSFRLYGGLAFVNLLLGDEKAAHSLFSKMREIAPQDPTTAWMEALSATMSGEYQQTLDWTSQTRADSPPIKTLMLDLSVLITADRKDFLTNIWALCEENLVSQTLTETDCFHLSFAKAIHEKDIPALLSHLNSVENIHVSSPHIRAMIGQALYLLPGYLLSDHKALFEDLIAGELNGGGFSNLASLNLLTAIHFAQHGNEIHSLDEINTKIAAIFNEKEMPISFNAEYLALLGDTDRAFTLLQSLVDSDDVIPIGRYYAYFDSPSFLLLNEDERFLELKKRYQRKLDILNRSLEWRL